MSPFAVLGALSFAIKEQGRAALQEKLYAACPSLYGATSSHLRDESLCPMRLCHLLERYQTITIRRRLILLQPPWKWLDSNRRILGLTFGPSPRSMSQISALWSHFSRT